jgi:hypothetical protein
LLAPWLKLRSRQVSRTGLALPSGIVSVSAACTVVHAGVSASMVNMITPNVTFAKVLQLKDMPVGIGIALQA